MKIKTKISFKEYRKLLFCLIYKKPTMIAIVGVGFAMILWILGYYLHFLPVPEPQIYQYITLSIIGVFQPLSVFWLLRRNYTSSNFLSQQVEIEVTTDILNIRGKSFYTELIWKYISKVDEVKNYILIYQNNLSCIFISKDDLTKTELKELKIILNSIPDVPMHLKETH